MVDLSDSNLTVAGGGGVTFVSTNIVKLVGSDAVLKPFDSSGLLLLSNYMKSSPVTDSSNCDSGAIDVSGSNDQWEGFIYAPRGQVKFAGSSNTSLAGAVVALTIEVSGSDLGFQSSAASTPSAGPVSLVE